MTQETSSTEMNLHEGGQDQMNQDLVRQLPDPANRDMLEYSDSLGERSEKVKYANNIPWMATLEMMI